MMLKLAMATMRMMLTSTMIGLKLPAERRALLVQLHQLGDRAAGVVAVP